MNKLISVRSKNVDLSVLPAVGLVVASLLVALAILIEGSAAKGLNGMGGLLWIGSAAVLVRSLSHEREFAKLMTVAAVECLILVLLLKPSSLGWAIFGFALGGAAIALLVRSRVLDWALLLPALWLPVHLLVAISRAVVRATTGGEAAVRSDPPPTAALVPFAMVIAALAGASMVDRMRERQTRARVLTDAGK